MSIVPDLPDPQYRAVPALSYSGAKKLIDQSPAHYRWSLSHPTFKDEFDLGHAVHEDLLGAGPGIVPVKVDDKQVTGYQQPAARAERDRIRAAGGVPVTVEQQARSRRMADAVRAHPVAGPLLDHDGLLREVSVFWTDLESGVPCKARLDGLRVEDADGRPRIVDVKTTDDVRVHHLARAVERWRYHWQNANYLESLEAHDVPDAAYSLVFVETDPPHAVRVVELDTAAVETGRRFMAAARRLYATCTAADRWPAYPPEPVLLGLSRYAPTHPEDVLL